MIDILLSTYNGEKYLRQQLDSILGQSYKNWRLIIRDDSSADTTLSIIKEYASRHPDKIIIVDVETANLGPSKSFDRLMHFVGAEYFMFSDQDDIWLSNKIERTFTEMQNLEAKYGTEKPLLVCCDAECIDGNGETICPSFYKSQKFIDTTGSDIEALGLNVVQGSTALMNRKVLSYILPIPDYVLHDQWIAVIVAHYGKISYLHEALLQYRQHGRNVLGTLDIGSSYFMHKILNFKKQMRIYSSFYMNLPFRVNLIKWIILKIIYTFRRI